MSADYTSIRAAVSADVPWLAAGLVVRGTLRIDGEALLVEPASRSGRRVAIPLGSIGHAGIESTLGMLPALVVRHTAAGREVRSRFEFVGEDDERDATGGPDLSSRIGPGLARDAASAMEGGLRALGGVWGEGKRTMRHAVDGIAHQEEYRAWPEAIAQAQATVARRNPQSSGGATGGGTDARTASAVSPGQGAQLRPIVPDDARLPAGDPRVVFPWFRAEVVGWLAACGARAAELGVRDLPVLAPLYPLDSQVLRLVVAGEFSRGKSTVINALFGIHGEIALPTGMTPTTPLACAIRVPNLGETDGATITYRTARPDRQLSLEEFRSGVRLAEEGNTGREAGQGQELHLDEARRIEVRVTGAYLPAGVEIEDTPGLNEQTIRSAAARSALGRADMAVFVLAADQLLGDLELQVIGELLAGHHRNLLFLVNFWDTIEAEEQRAILRQRVATVLRDVPALFGDLPTPPVFYISALQAARAQRQRKPASEESGVPAVRAALRELLGPHSTALLLRARAGRAMRYLGLLRAAVSGASASEGTTGATSRQGDAHRAAIAARTILNELQPAVARAVAPEISVLRRQESDLFHRAHALLLQATATPEGTARDAVLVEARRLLGAELRATVGRSTAPAQQAVDLLCARMRAAFLTRQVPAPELSAHLDAGPWALPEELDPVALQELLEGAAVRTDEMWRVAASAAFTVLDSALREFDPGAPPTPTGPPAGRDHRHAALQRLEEDLARLDRILKGCLNLV